MYLLSYDPLKSEVGAQSVWCSNLLIGACTLRLPALPPMAVSLVQFCVSALPPSWHGTRVSNNLIHVW